MSEAFHPIRYLDYWERTSPQERYNRRPAYEEHDVRKAEYAKSYDEHNVCKVDYAKLYEDHDRRRTDFPKSNAAQKQTQKQWSQEPAAKNLTSTISNEPSSHRRDPGSSLSTLDSSDLTLVSALDSVDDVNPEIKGIRSDGIPTGFESQSTIICEDQLSALMMSDFDDEIIDKGAMGDVQRHKVLSSTADDSLLANVAGHQEGNKYNDQQS